MHVAKSGEAVKSGPIGLAVILLLCIACYFLFKSMSKHLRTVRQDFPADEAGKAQQVRAEAAATPADTSTAVDLHKTPGGAGPAKPSAPPSASPPRNPPPVHP
jgi:hypothetical protein